MDDSSGRAVKVCSRVLHDLTANRVGHSGRVIVSHVT